MFVCDRPDKYRTGRAPLDDGVRGLPSGLQQQEARKTGRQIVHCAAEKNARRTRLASVVPQIDNLDAGGGDGDGARRYTDDAGHKG